MQYLKNVNFARKIVLTLIKIVLTLIKIVLTLIKIVLTHKNCTHTRKKNHKFLTMYCYYYIILCYI